MARTINLYIKIDYR